MRKVAIEAVFPILLRRCPELHLKVLIHQRGRRCKEDAPGFGTQCSCKKSAAVPRHTLSLRHTPTAIFAHFVQRRLGYAATWAVLTTWRDGSFKSNQPLTIMCVPFSWLHDNAKGANLSEVTQNAVFSCSATQTDNSRATPSSPMSNRPIHRRASSAKACCARDFRWKQSHCACGRWRKA